VPLVLLGSIALLLLILWLIELINARDLAFLQNFGLKMGLYDFASPPSGRAGVQNVRVEFVKVDIGFMYMKKISC